MGFILGEWLYYFYILCLQKNTSTLFSNELTLPNVSNVSLQT